MASDDPRDILDLRVDLDNLHREETFTDLAAATIRRLTPVTADGSPDLSRPPFYIGETSLMTQVGPIPVQFTLEAQNLEEAFRLFPEGVKVAVEQLQERQHAVAVGEFRLAEDVAQPLEIGLVVAALVDGAHRARDGLHH